MELKPLPCPPQPNPYTVLGRKLIYASPWIRIREDEFRHRKGAEGRYAICGFLRSACGVLVVDDRDRVALVGQWRYPLEGYSWELPEGGGDPSESPFEAIRRELAEEAGVAAAIWEPLCFFHPSNSSTEEEAYVFLASGISPTGAHSAEDDEELLLHWEPFEDCLRRVLAGEITDGMTVVALLALQARRSGISSVLNASLAERFFLRPEDHPSLGRARWANLEQP